MELTDWLHEEMASRNGTGKYFDPVGFYTRSFEHIKEIAKKQERAPYDLAVLASSGTEEGGEGGEVLLAEAWSDYTIFIYMHVVHVICSIA